MNPKPIDTLESLLVPELGVGAPEGAAAAVALAAAGDAGEPSRALRDRVMGSLGRGGRFGIFADRLARLFDIPIENALRLLAKVEDPASWRPGPAPGIQMMPVRPGPKYDGAIAAIGRLAPGARFPRHGHIGAETTLVMAGGFRDSSGVEIERGDELFEPPGTEHDFVVLDGEDCIAAVLALGGVDMR